MNDDDIEAPEPEPNRCPDCGGLRSIYADDCVCKATPERPPKFFTDCGALARIYAAHAGPGRGVPRTGGATTTTTINPMDDETIQRIAKFLAAAYWRGRLHGLGSSGTVEAMIDAASDADAPDWVASAKASLS